MKDLEIRTTDGICLRGTLSMPSDSKPKGLLIPVHGSFVQTRDGDLDGTQRWMFPEGVPKRRLFSDMTASLLGNGWGTFCYDKRASGASGGDYAETDLERLAQDLTEVYKAMRKLYPQTPIGFAGQSEGSLTVLKASTTGSCPDFLVLQGPALEPFDITLEFQRTHAAAPFLTENLKGPLSKKYPYLAALYHAFFFEDLLEKARVSTDKYYELNWNGFRYRTNLKKYREYLWNGLEMLEHVSVPTLVVMGDQDGNVRPSTADWIIEQQKHGRYPNVSVQILAGLEHSFKEATPGENFVDSMSKPLSPKYLKVLNAFCAGQEGVGEQGA